MGRIDISISFKQGVNVKDIFCFSVPKVPLRLLVQKGQNLIMRTCGAFYAGFPLNRISSITPFSLAQFPIFLLRASR